MDSLTQAVLGASIGGAIAPKGSRRKALLVGAALGTLPDLDVFIDFGGAVENFTFHRGFSHSLFVLTPLSVLLWLVLRRWWAPVREAPYRWLALISLVLVTHPLLDAHTAYGTQLFWPLDVHPTMWATLFIIDPLYTLPLLVGVIFMAVRPLTAASGTVLRSALAISVAYIAWSWAAHGIVKGNVEDALADMGLDDAPIFLTPTPFNTLLWRVVVMTDDGYLEGFDSLVIDEGGIDFVAYSSDMQSLDDASDVWAVAQLRWFSHDFLRARVIDDRLVLADLRMGTEPTYVFTHVVAVRENPRWAPVTTELLPVSFDDRALGELWQRIWSE
ncbi:MAG: metal-dependent hydrolase [Woeseiaceae bacterium]|nr:metal-dependent hydrolase [Woeseiaceae bacterium]